VVAVKHELHVRPDALEGPVLIAGLVLRSREQRARLLRDDSSLEKYIDQCGGRFNRICRRNPPL
jgi:hypothetical protein